MSADLDIWGRPLAELPDWQLREDARAMISDAFTLANALAADPLTHLAARRRIPFLDRDALLATVKDYTGICGGLRRRFASEEERAGSADRRLAGQDALQQALDQRLRDLTPPCAPDRPNGAAPRALILGGQPGSGKTLMQDVVRLSFPEYTAVYDGDDNALFHPDFQRIVRHDPHNGHGTAADELPEDFHSRCLDHLSAGETKYDVIASHPLGRREWADSWVEGFKRHGYHVTVAIVSANAADSRLGILHRYQRQRDREGYARWVPPELHDEFHENIPAVAEHLEASPNVDVLYIIDRDGLVIYNSERPER
ncbi:zeta toxin family protein [Nocardiopsis sp. RSe5-2]|uniref:UDP-N-acetylglucosamine kinase n=1 Tax=Nocardiopsis endophytica TaxID=3018445 RepID=A0ABT4TZ19_9ACTN|nr:zeta toxin family protein [Nocardiopsis endophytica]MDA2809479.1 zeta toxin family protein [Nocardiopsis endophytica]